MPAEEQAEFFHQKVEPLLREHCYECHSHESGQMESGLALDWKSGWATGGERGPAIMPGQPDASLLIRAIQHRDAELMMPEEKLADGHIETLIQWVRDGAYDDRTVEPQSAGRVGLVVAQAARCAAGSHCQGSGVGG